MEQAKSRKQARFERRLQRRQNERKQAREHFLYPRMSPKFCQQHEEEIGIILKRLQHDFPKTVPKEGRRALKTGIFQDLGEWRYETSLGFPISEELLSAALSIWCDGVDYFRALQTGRRYDLDGHITLDDTARACGTIRLSAFATGSFQQDWLQNRKARNRVPTREAIAISQEAQEDYPTLFQQALRFWCCGVRYAEALAEGLRYGLTGKPTVDPDAARYGLAKLKHYEEQKQKGNA